MFGHRQRLRQLAAHMLLVWVLALVTTVVNACVVLPGQWAQHSACAEAAAVAQDPHHRADSGAQEAPVPAAEKTPCAKFCDEDSSGVTSAQRVTDGLGALGLAPLPTLALAVRAALAPARVLHTQAGSMPAAVPVAIAFLRLTL